jgi:hypothetical protein
MPHIETTYMLLACGAKRKERTSVRSTLRKLNRLTKEDARDISENNMTEPVSLVPTGSNEQSSLETIL